MPLDGSAPSALRVSGGPVDQFSFLESENEQLNVLVRSDSAGDGMWSAERAAGDVALLRVPLASFSDGSETAPVSIITRCQSQTATDSKIASLQTICCTDPEAAGGVRQATETGKIYAVKWTTGESQILKLVHGVDRIEALGDDAVVVGTDGRDLHFTSVRLGADT